MKYLILFLVFITLIMTLSCNSDDDNEIQPVVTSFSGNILYEGTMDPIVKADLIIIGTDSEPLRSPIFRADTILRVENGVFEASFETIGEVDRFAFAIEIFEGDSDRRINAFAVEDGLQCLPGNCGNFPPGQDYELTILVPCDPDDCVQFQ